MSHHTTHDKIIAATRSSSQLAFTTATVASCRECSSQIHPICLVAGDGSWLKSGIAQFLAHLNHYTAISLQTFVQSISIYRAKDKNFTKPICKAIVLDDMCQSNSLQEQTFDSEFIGIERASTLRAWIGMSSLRSLYVGPLSESDPSAAKTSCAYIEGLINSAPKRKEIFSSDLFTSKQILGRSFWFQGNENNHSNINRDNCQTIESQFLSRRGWSWAREKLSHGRKTFCLYVDQSWTVLDGPEVPEDFLRRLCRSFKDAALCWP